MSESEATRIADWLNEHSDGPITYEKVELGDEQVLPDRERRELDALRSRLSQRGRGVGP